VPDNPDGWLLAVARNRRRDLWKSAAARTSTTLVPDRDAAVHVDPIDPEAIPDKRLALMLVCAHPAINPAMHTPLMLNTVLGFTAEQVARAFSIPTTTLAARLVRAKRRIRAARIPFDIPDRTVLPSRMQAVLEAVYGTFAIDWHSGGTRTRDSLTAEALFLADILAELAPADAEAHGLAALISLSNARLAARFDVGGRLVPLPDQDTALWDEDLIDRGAAHLRAAHQLGAVGRFQLEAAIQSVHCARRVTGQTDWRTISDLYRTLDGLAPTLGGAVALAAVTAEVDGPEQALRMLDEITDTTGHFQPAWTTRAHLLDGLGRTADAVVAFDKAISLTTDPAERAHLEMRRARLG
jgi:RNA polymerase sigma-70 factor (ECF subfamily)